MYDREDSNRYINSRIGLWCPCCGASEGKACKPVGGNRFDGHDATATGTVPRVVIPVQWEPIPRRDVPVKKETSRRRPASTPPGWLQ